MNEAWLDAPDGEGDQPNPVSIRFMEMACRAMVRLERSGAFNVLPRTDDFATCVSDHDEGLSDSLQRLAKVRESAT